MSHARASFTDVSMNPSGVLAVNEVHGRNLHLLAIEGRGICGLTALIILKEVLRQYQYSQKLPQLPRPCDVFDLAGGTGTGGIIAIMLFRLGMTVDEAITAYTTVSKNVFSIKSARSNMKTRASLLENAITTIIYSSLSVDNIQAQNVRMLDDKGPKCFVGASTVNNLSTPTLFRTYGPPCHATYDCTIVEAIRATTAQDPFFPSIDIGDANIKESFIHVGSRVNNPVKAVMEEARLIFPGQHMSCVLSIGSGARGIIDFATTSAAKRAKGLKDLMDDGEHISEEVARVLSDRGVFYCRLNVDYGLGDIDFEDWEKLGDVRVHTQKYLEKYEVTKKVSQLVQGLNQRTGAVEFLSMKEPFLMSVSKAIASTVEETLMVLGQFLDRLTAILPGESWSTLISKFSPIYKSSKTATETFNMQCALLQDTLKACMKGKNLVRLPEELKRNIKHLLEGLKKTFEDSHGQEDPMTHINTNIQQLLQHFWIQNHIAGNIVVHEILKYIQKNDSIKKGFTRLEQHAINQNLGSLNVSPFAAYDSSGASKRASCFKGTRIKLLNEIASWMVSDDASLAPIYVLDGVAGIGKSTIAQTVAEQAAGINALGASFFFSRSDDERKTAKTFFSTIAYQLAYYDKDFADQINEALLRTPHVVTQMPPTQFSTLILEPLKEGFAVAGSPILIVVDALDECEIDGDSLLKIFADWIESMPRLRLFITTRPEHHIRIVLDRYRHLKRFHLQDIEDSVVQSDIRLYLDFHLSDNQIRDKLPDLKCTWKPTEADLEVLVGICGTLFIIASTAVKFILDSKRSDPEKQLSRLLRGVSRRDFSGSKHTTAMDSFYTQILLAAVPDDDEDDEDDDWFEQYQIVVGTIVALQYPLPCAALSALLNLGPDGVTRTLSHLYSLVAPTGQNLAFRIHHKSFPDFVTNPSRCEHRFLINLKTRHLELGKRCLSIMNSQLKPNTCNLGSADRFQDNSNTQHLIQDYISPELAYASTHWATHLSYAENLDDEAEKHLECFAGTQILAWLEVLSMLGHVGGAHSNLDRIGKLLDECKTTAGITREIFHDGCRFIASNIEILKVSAGHVFSAFAFVPQDTRLFRTYGGLKEMHLRVVSGYEKTWNSTISIMTEHQQNAYSVTFSRDGMKLASASYDGTVRLWDGHTGALTAVLRGHSNWVNPSVLFSLDGTRLASALSDDTVRLWDGQTGAEITVLQGRSVVFLPDGKKLASASSDGTVRLWDSRTGAEIAVVRGHFKLDRSDSIVFSPDGERLALGSHDGTVRLLDGQTGAEIAIFRGHSDVVDSVVFSPDGTRLASASRDGTVRLLDGQTGAEITIFRGHSAGVDSIVFSPDGARLASASRDGTVRLWDIQTSAEIAVLQKYSHLVNSVAFSPNGERLASASRDRTVRLWDGQTGAEIAVFRGHSDGVDSVAFSPDGKRLASASGGTVRLLDGQTCADIAVLHSHKNSVDSIVFSPDGTRLASASIDGVVLWDGQTGAEIAVFQGHLICVDFGCDSLLVFSPDGKRLTSTLHDELPPFGGKTRLWDGKTGAEIAILLQVEKYPSGVTSVVFSPDSSRLASASREGTVRLWDGQTGAEIAVLQGHCGYVRSLVFSSDCTRLASSSMSDGGAVRLWDGRTGAGVAVLQGHCDYVKQLAFLPDSLRLASSSMSDGAAGLLWDELWDGIARNLSDVHLVVFSPDCKRLASASGDGTIRLWNGQTSAEIAVLFQGQLTSIYSLVFSADGTRLASVSSDKIVRLWDGQTGATIADFPGFGFVAFTLSGSKLLSMNAEELFLVHLSKLAIPLGLLIQDQDPKGVQVPGSNAWVILVERKQPSLQGLLVVKVDDSLQFTSLCWFPPDSNVINHTVSSSRIAVGCENGHVLLLDVDFSSLL